MADEGRDSQDTLCRHRMQMRGAHLRGAQQCPLLFPKPASDRKTVGERCLYGDISGGYAHEEWRSRALQTRRIPDSIGFGIARDTHLDIRVLRSDECARQICYLAPHPYVCRRTY